MTARQFNRLYPGLSLPTAAPEIPAAVSTLHKRQRKMGLHIIATGDRYRLRRNDGTLGQSAHRSVSSFCKKYNVTSVYHYSSHGDNSAIVEATFKK